MIDKIKRKVLIETRVTRVWEKHNFHTVNEKIHANKISDQLKSQGN